MPTCKKCGLNFSCWGVIGGKRYNLSNRKYCLQCSPFKQHNTKQLHIVPDTNHVDGLCDCCKRELPNFRRKLCSTCSVNKRRLKLRQLALEYKGGKCCICGYHTTYYALQFHHLDPDTKKFAVSDKPTGSWIKLKRELDKCILVCSNCHAEIHAGLLRIDNSVW